MCIDSLKITIRTKLTSLEMFHNQQSKSNNGRPFKFEKRERIIANDADLCRWLALSTRHLLNSIIGAASATTKTTTTTTTTTKAGATKRNKKAVQQKQEPGRTRAWEFDAIGGCFPKLFGVGGRVSTIVKARFINDYYWR